MELSTPEDAYRLLEELGAPAHLLQHARLVHGVLEELISFVSPDVSHLRTQEMRLGAILHDVGKVHHTEELHRSGNLHEAKGKELLLARGVQPEVAAYCTSHARWDDEDRTLEELMVSLADKLWKGKRVALLEQKFVALLEQTHPLDSWELLIACDNLFEAIADQSTTRLHS